MERLKKTAWYKCLKCGKILHGENFYKLPNGGRTSECVNCYDKYGVLTDDRDFMCDVDQLFETDHNKDYAKRRFDAIIYNSPELFKWLDV